MADEKSKRDTPQADGVSVQYFAREQGITPGHVKDLIKQFGNDRDKLEDAARQLRERF